MSESEFMSTLMLFEKNIREIQWDDESAHCAEDKMHLFFIENCTEVDRETLREGQIIVDRVTKMEFSRWCA